MPYLALFLLLFFPIGSHASGNDPLLNAVQTALQDASIMIKQEKIPALPVCENAQYSVSERHNNRVTVTFVCPHPYFKRSFPVRLAKWEEVAVTRKSLAKGTRIAQDDVVFEKRDVFQIHEPVLTSLEAANGLELKQAIPANHVIKESMLNPIPCVIKGQLVILQALGKGVSVQTQATALGNAKKGELVAVKNPKSGKIIEGVAIKPGWVQIQL